MQLRPASAWGVGFSAQRLIRLVQSPFGIDCELISKAEALPHFLFPVLWFSSFFPASKLLRFFNSYT